MFTNISWRQEDTTQKKGGSLLGKLNVWVVFNGYFPPARKLYLKENSVLRGGQVTKPQTQLAWKAPLKNHRIQPLITTLSTTFWHWVPCPVYRKGENMVSRNVICAVCISKLSSEGQSQVDKNRKGAHINKCEVINKSLMVFIGKTSFSYWKTTNRFSLLMWCS